MPPRGIDSDSCHNPCVTARVSDSILASSLSLGTRPSHGADPILLQSFGSGVNAGRRTYHCGSTTSVGTPIVLPPSASTSCRAASKPFLSTSQQSDVSAKSRKTIAVARPAPADALNHQTSAMPLSSVKSMKCHELLGVPLRTPCERANQIKTKLGKSFRRKTTLLLLKSPVLQEFFVPRVIQF